MRTDARRQHGPGISRILALVGNGACAQQPSLQVQPLDARIEVNGLAAAAERVVAAQVAFSLSLASTLCSSRERITEL